MSGVDIKRNSLKEVYALAAFSKKQFIEAKKTIALVLAAAGGKPDSIKQALQDYLEEQIPAMAESREAFMSMAQNVLGQEAGKIINLSDYKPLS